MVLMGARVDNPGTGLFLTPDSILGGGVGPYSYPTDPNNQLDLTGQMWSWRAASAMQRLRVQSPP
jgi:large repetitive protein